MSFEKFNLPLPVTQAVKELHYDKPTAIQEKAIPLIMEGKDVVGQSETGSGKTAAFGLPVLGKIKGPGVQMLVITPTRELCVQVADSLSRFGRHLQIKVATVYGGVGMNPQIVALRSANVIVACPGRLLDLMQQGAANLKNVRFLVLDEADRMFDMGFIRDIEKILKAIPSQRQTLLFSATMPGPVRQLVQRFMRSPIFIDTVAHVDKSKLREAFYEVKQDDKFSLLLHLLKHETPGMALVFCGKRHIVDKVVRQLNKNGVDAMAIHGGLSQNKRDAAIRALHNKDTAVLVATDVAARGLHIRDITHVYNFDLPNVSEDYTHRIGRTARAGAEGDAVTLLSEKDRDLIKPIMRLGHVMSKRQLPEFERVMTPRLSSGSQGGGGFRQQGRRRFDNRPRSNEGRDYRTGFHVGGPRQERDGPPQHRQRSEGERPAGHYQKRSGPPQHHQRSEGERPAGQESSGRSEGPRPRQNNFHRKTNNRHAWRRPRS
jgi:ATP-dependent RNA helicase DeaD